MRENEPKLSFVPVAGTDGDTIRRLSAFASAVVKQHFGPIIGAAQNDYMIRRFQSPEAIRRQIDAGALYCLVLCRGELIGFLACFPKPDAGRQKLYLSKFYLAAQQRGKGFARQMLDFVEAQARTLGLDAVFLNVNRHNRDVIAVYRHLGFAVIREEKNDIGGGFFMDDYVMELPVV